MKIPLVIAYGGGTNSTAMLIGMVECGIRPDLILFADTGGEKPETYEYVGRFRNWLVEHGMPEIVDVYNDGMYKSLEDNCLRKQMLPSLAYGFKSCSDKYKRRPQDKYVREWEPARWCWKQERKVKKAIGYAAHEIRRAGIEGDKEYQYVHPLIEWGWDQDDCLDAIQRHDLPFPGKSACFFCPASKKRDVFWLHKHHPDLFERAVAMERNAAPNLKTVKGLGRSWSWEQLITEGIEASRVLPECLELPCMCFDGEYD